MLKLSMKTAIVGILFLTSCSSNNKPLVSYQVGENIETVSIGEALEAIEPALAMMQSSEVMQITNMEFLQDVVYNTLLNRRLLVLEALEISNFAQDPLYIESLEKQQAIMPYALAIQKGQEELLKIIDKQEIAVAEVSRIMFTNNDMTQAQEVLDRLQGSENLVEDFSLLAAEFSQEPLGSQTGGYLGMIDDATYPDLKEVVFTKKNEGLYPELVQGEFGMYIVYIHTKAKTHKYKDIKDQALAISPASIQQKYLADKIKILFERDGETVTLGSKTYTLAEFPKDKDLVKIWNKGYSLNDVSIILEGFGVDPDSDNSILLGALANDGVPSRLLEQMAVIYKAYSPSIKNTKEFKQNIVQSKQQLEMDSAAQILSEHLFKDFSTNVTDKELRDAYADPENRRIKSYNNNDEPVYASFQESKDDLTNVVLRKRAGEIEAAFLSRLPEKYNIVWDEKSFQILTDKVEDLIPDEEDEHNHSEHDGHDHGDHDGHEH